MSVEKIDISINTESEILFNHIIDIPNLPSPHNFHLHDNIEIYVFIEGDVDYIIEEQYIPLKRGDIIVINPNAIHKPIIKSSCKYERFFINLSFDSLSFINKGEHPLTFVNRATKDSILSLNIYDFENAIYLLKRISALIQEGSKNSYIIFSYLLRFFHILNTSSKSVSSFETRANNTSALIKDILKYINSNEINKISVNSLANEFHINPSYLSTLFSKTTQINLKEYLTTKKISKAKTMLLDNYSITETAYDCGFSSTSHFIAIFKKITNQTPREYLKEMK